PPRAKRVVRRQPPVPPEPPPPKPHASSLTDPPGALRLPNSTVELFGGPWTALLWSSGGVALLTPVAGAGPVRDWGIGEIIVGSGCRPDGVMG
ncbi:MAG: hypothetical protein WAN20_23750, partial [Pseudonocardiaceae bacterium]